MVYWVFLVVYRRVIYAEQYKTRPNNVITRYGDRFEYATLEETSSLMVDLVTWYNQAEEERKTLFCGVGCIVPFLPP